MAEREDLGTLQCCSPDEPTSNQSHLGDLPPPPVRGAFGSPGGSGGTVGAVRGNTSRVSLSPRANLSPRGGGPVEEATALLQEEGGPAQVPPGVDAPSDLGAAERAEERERSASKKERAARKASRKQSKKLAAAAAAAAAAETGDVPPSGVPAATMGPAIEAPVPPPAVAVAPDGGVPRGATSGAQLQRQHPPPPPLPTPPPPPPPPPPQQSAAAGSSQPPGVSMALAACAAAAARGGAPSELSSGLEGPSAAHGAITSRAAAGKCPDELPSRPSSARNTNPNALSERKAGSPAPQLTPRQVDGATAATAAEAAGQPLGIFVQDMHDCIQWLEASRWRVVLEHSKVGEVVAVAAFAPGGPTAPGTPVRSDAPGTPLGGIFGHGASPFGLGYPIDPALLCGGGPNAVAAGGAAVVFGGGCGSGAGSGCAGGGRCGAVASPTLGMPAGGQHHGGGSAGGGGDSTGGGSGAASMRRNSLASADSADNLTALDLALHPEFQHSGCAADLGGPMGGGPQRERREAWKQHASHPHHHHLHHHQQMREPFYDYHGHGDGGARGFEGYYHRCGAEQELMLPPRRPLTPPLTPHTMLDERPPALRPGAPSFFWTALQAAGLHEAGLSGGRRPLPQFVALLYSVAVLLALLVQIGMLVCHWTEVLEVHIATAIFLAVVADWVNLALFLQTGHLHRLLSASAFSLAALPASDSQGHYRTRLSPEAAVGSSAKGRSWPLRLSGMNGHRSRATAGARAAGVRAAARDRLMAWHGGSGGGGGGGKSSTRRGRGGGAGGGSMGGRAAPSPPASPPGGGDGDELVLELSSLANVGVSAGSGGIATGGAAGGDGDDDGGVDGGGNAGSNGGNGGDASLVGYAWPAWATPVALWAPCRAALRRQVAMCALATLLTAVALGGFEWWWKREMRRDPHRDEADAPALSSGVAIYPGSDVVLWAMGVEAGAPMTVGQNWRWWLASGVSCLVTSACYWAPLGCVACMREVHGHLLSQLNDATLAPLGGVGGAAVLLEGSREVTELVAQSSSKLAIFSSSHVLVWAYVGYASLVGLSQHGWTSACARPLIAVALFATLGVVHLVFLYDAINLGLRAGLRRAAAMLLRAQLRQGSNGCGNGGSGGAGGNGASAGLLGALEAVTLEAQLGSGMMILGLEVPPRAGLALLVLSVAAAIGTLHYVLVVTVAGDD